MTYRKYRRKKAIISAVSMLLLAAGMVLMAMDCSSLIWTIITKLLMLGFYILAGSVFEYGDKLRRRHRYYSEGYCSERQQDIERLRYGKYRRREKVS